MRYCIVSSFIIRHSRQNAAIYSVNLSSLQELLLQDQQPLRRTYNFLKSSDREWTGELKTNMVVKGEGSFGRERNDKLIEQG